MTWSRVHDRCQDCGTVARPHWARGLCRRCYQRPRMRQRQRLEREQETPRQRAARLRRLREYSRAWRERREAILAGERAIELNAAALRQHSS